MDFLEALKPLETNTYYVFFKDGSWRTCTDAQWKEEQLWKLEPETMWVGGPGTVRVIKAWLARNSMLEKKDAD